jgi:hypothetical protein
MIKSTHLTDYYFGDTKADGVCMFCGKTGIEHVKAKNGKTYIKQQYHLLFEKISWFRGDDKPVGKVCDNCKKNFQTLMHKRLTQNQS